MNQISVKINAKINLSLNVTGVSDNGFHYLDMVVASVNISDAIAISKRGDENITCRFVYGKSLINPLPVDENNNTVIRAGRLITEKFGTCGMDITVNKEIPLSGGLGGSSADAAGVIAAAASLLGIDTNAPEMLAIALKCGSDVALQLSNGYKRVTGIGERIEKLNGIPEYDIVIAKGAGGVNAKDSYRLFDTAGTANKNVNQAELITALRERNFDKIRKNINNDLYLPSSLINKDIAGTINALKSTEAEAVLMSGSGAACFGIYRDSKAARNAAAELKGLEYVRAVKTVL